MAVRLRRSQRIGSGNSVVERQRASSRESRRRERHGHQELRGAGEVIRSFRASKVWKVFNKNVEKFVEKASPGTLTARTAKA
jgi:hypothetical protein